MSAMTLVVDDFRGQVVGRCSGCRAELFRIPVEIVMRWAPVNWRPLVQDEIDAHACGVDDAPSMSEGVRLADGPIQQRFRFLADDE